MHLLQRFPQPHKIIISPQNRPILLFGFDCVVNVSLLEQTPIDDIVLADSHVDIQIKQNTELRAFAAYISWKAFEVGWLAVLLDFIALLKFDERWQDVKFFLVVCSLCFLYFVLELPHDLNGLITTFFSSSKSQLFKSKALWPGRLFWRKVWNCSGSKLASMISWYR